MSLVRTLLLVLLLLLCAALAAAQKSDGNFALVGIPIIVEKRSVAITFRAVLEGKPVRVEKIDTPETVPLRIVVIDLRRANTATVRAKDELPPGLRSLYLRGLRAQAALIRIGSPPPEEKRIFAGWKLYASPDFEAALRQAESLFAAGGSERQSLLVIKNASPPAELFDADRLNAAAISSAAGRLVTVLPAVPSGKVGVSFEAILKTQLKKWRDSLSSFYMLRVATEAVPATGGRIEAQAISGNKVIGRGSRQFNFLLPPPFSDEVETAFADYPRLVNFETLEKYSGLTEAEVAFYKNHYAPPIEGVVVDTDPLRNERLKKLGDRVFLLHRVERKCAVVLLDSRLPTVFTWKLTFVSLTVKDLEILNDEEITALIAHEIGHLYLAGDLLKARTSGDDRLARLTELKCDLIALETLRRLGIDETNLPLALEKLIQARSAMNIKSLEAGSPDVGDRRRIAQKYIESRKK